MERVTVMDFSHSPRVNQVRLITARTVIHLAASFIMFWTTLVYSQTPPSTALRFTADGQYVLVPHTEEVDMIGGELTIEAWVKPGVGLSRGYNSIVSKQLSGTGYMLATNVVVNPPEHVGEVRYTAEVAGVQVGSASQPGVSGWHHVAAVWDGQLKIYVNGQLDGVANTGSPIPNSFDLWIGSSPFGANTNWRGVIDEVRIWAVARTQEQIQLRMSEYLCGNETGLRAYWSFDEGQGQQLLDTLGKTNGFISGAEWVAGVELLSQKNCAAIAIPFEVKPDHINPNSRGLLTVTILTRDTFDAATIDPTTVRFGESGTEAAPVDVNKKDVNGDGQPDLLLRFRILDTGIQCGDSSVSITGQTVNGTPIEGSDSITTVGCKPGRVKRSKPHFKAPG